MPEACVAAGIVNVSDCASFLAVPSSRSTEEPPPVRPPEVPVEETRTPPAVNAGDTSVALPSPCLENNITVPDDCWAFIESRRNVTEPLPEPEPVAGSRSAELPEEGSLPPVIEPAAETAETEAERAEVASQTARDVPTLVTQERHVEKETTAATEDRRVIPKATTSAEEARTDEATEAVLDRLAPSMQCEDLTNEQCVSVFRQDHLEALMEADKEHEREEAVLDAAIGDSGEIDPVALQVRADDMILRVDAIMPIDIRHSGRLHVFKSRAGFALGADGKMRSAAGWLLAHDDDGDGVPNDVETRLGTDPQNADSDGDGVSDRDELRRMRTSGVDRAVLQGRTIGQPTIEGAVDEHYTVALGDLISGQDGMSTTELTGTGEPGRVVTLYIYSDMPMVVTTTVDANGQWTFDLRDQLKDGVHEVYVAVNDDTGKVVKKSNPLSFVVNTAVAASAGDAAAEPTATGKAAEQPTVNVADGSRVNGDWSKYMVAGGSLIVIAILALFLVLRSMHKPPEPPQQ